MPPRSIPDGEEQLPRVPAALLRFLLPYAERDEVLGDLREEHRQRVQLAGRASASRWLWRQVLSSLPALVSRGWWRGWTGFEPRANRMQPGGGMFESLGKDVRYALRRLRNRPTYTALTVLTLSLGVAGSAAVYGIARQLLLEPLPYTNEEELAVFWFDGSWSEAEILNLEPLFEEEFAGVAGIRPGDTTLESADGPTRMLRGIRGTANLFSVLGVSPAIGTGFRPGDDRAGAEPVTVLSHQLWSELGADPAIIGEVVQLGGVARTVVGVMPEGFWYPDPGVQVWLSEGLDPEDGSGQYTMISRLPPGRSIESMRPQLARITSELDELFDYPAEWDKTAEPALAPIRERLVGEVRPTLIAVIGAMALILLIASVNVAALMLGQVDSRSTELAVRAALGAGRRQLLQQLALESLVIGAMAGVVGSALAFLAFRFLLIVLPLGALGATATLDWSLFGAAMGIALLAGSAVALAPGISIARSNLQTQLTRSRTSGIGGRGGGLESMLVVAQVALVLLLASGAALLIRSVGNLRAIDPGVDVEGVAVIDIVMPQTLSPEEFPRMVRQLLGAVESLPGVSSAAVTQRLPLRGSGDNWGIIIEGRPDVDATTSFRVVSPDYFETMGIEIRSGRGLLATDVADLEEGAVVVNEELAERYFPGIDPVGQRIAFMDRWDRIVGVVENVAETDLDAPVEPARYMVYDQVPFLLTAQAIALRTSGRDPAALLDEARRAIEAGAPGVAIEELTTMVQVFNTAIGPARQVMMLLAALGALAMILGTVGVYGVVSHFVTRRRRDWGIRMALGMRPGVVIGRIVGTGGALVGVGLLLGLLGFLLLARLLSSLLYGVGPSDPLAILFAAGALLTTGLLAAYIPARRASRMNTALVLREQ